MSERDVPNPYAGSSYRNESSVDINFQNDFDQKAIEDFRLQLNKFED